MRTTAASVRAAAAVVGGVSKDAGMTGAFTHSKSESRTAEQWWELAGRTLSPSRAYDPHIGTTQNAALISCTYALAADLVTHLVRAGATQVEVGQVRTLPEGGNVI